MNYLKVKKIDKLYFNSTDLSEVLGITPASAKVSCTRYVKSGVLIRLKRGFYILRDKWDILSAEEKYSLANILQVPSYISLMSALGYYELTTQMQQNFIESVDLKRTKEINVAGTVFNYTRIKRQLYFGFVKNNGFFMAEPEKAFLDMLYLSSLNKYKFDSGSVAREKLNRKKIEIFLKQYPLKVKLLWNKYGSSKKTRDI